MVAQMLTPPPSAHFSNGWDKFNAFSVQGKYLANSLSNGTNGNIARTSTPNLLTGILQDLASQGRRVPDDISILLSAVETEFKGGLQDDRKYLVCALEVRETKMVLTLYRRSESYNLRLPCQKIQAVCRI